jgi:hypothetical protein
MAHFGSTSVDPSEQVPVRGQRWRNVKAMTLVWVSFGILIGAGTSPPHGGSIGLISGILAGVIVFPWMGAALGLLGCQPRPTILGGGFGALVGAAGLMAVSPTAALNGACFGLIAGALVGATVLPVIRFYKRILSFAVRAPLAMSASRGR